MVRLLEWTRSYDRSRLSGDLSAGITTGIMLIPQGMAYALIAGLPPIHGLYAALIPPVIYALLGTSYQLSVGPVATTSLLVFAGLSELNVTGANFILFASLLALIVGIIQLAFGVSRMGFIVNFLSKPIISGYTSAAAFIIGFSQLKNLLGIESKTSSKIYAVVSHTLQNIDEINWHTLLFGLVAIALLIMIKRINAKLPAALIVTILSLSIVYIFNMGQLIAILGQVPSGLPAFQNPIGSWNTTKELVPLALIIALVGFLESISISKALQTKTDNYTIDANRELKALGMANIAGAFFKAFPVSGGLSRSAVHKQAGANTPLALIFSAILIGLTLLFLTPVFYYVPKSVLAAIIIVAVSKLVDLREARKLWSISKRDFWMMMTTFLATLTIGIQEGIMTGVLLSLGMVIYKSTYPHTAVLGKLPDTNYYRNLNRFPEAYDREDALIFRFDAQLYFANIQFFIDQLYKLIKKKNGKVKVIVINSQAINDLDMSAVYGLKDFIRDMKEKGMEIYFTEVIGPVRDIMKKTGLNELIGKDHFHMRIQDALDHFDNKFQSAPPYATQSND